MDFVVAASEEKEAVAQGVSKSVTADSERVETPLDWVYNESIDPTILEGIETLTDEEKLKEAAESEWRHKRITIIPND